MFEFYHSIEAQMEYEHRETNGARFGVFYKENLRNDCEPVLSPRRTGFIKTKFHVGRLMKRLIAIDGSDRA